MERLVEQVETPITRAGHFARGFMQPMRAFSLLLRTRGLKRYAVLPLLINSLVYFGVVAIAVYLLWGWDIEVAQWDGLWGAGAYLSAAANWLAGPLKWLIAIPLIAVVCYFSFTAVGMVVASPFNDMLSEKVEQALCDEKPLQEIPWELTLRAMAYGLFDAVRGSARQLLVTLCVLPFLLIPVVGLVMFFLVQAYAAGRGFTDVPMARNFLRPRHKRPFIRTHRMEILGLGVAMQLLFFIPLVGLVMLPIGVVAGTQLYCQGSWEKLIKDNGLDWPEAFHPPLLNCANQPAALATSQPADSSPGAPAHAAAADKAV